MTDANIGAKELRSLVALATKKTLAFAYCPGSKGELLFLLDKKKKPGSLGLIAKKEGPGKNVAFGTCRVVGNVMELTCEKSLNKMSKTLHRYFMAQKIRLSFEILDFGGTVLERADEPRDEAEAGADDAHGSDLDPAELVARIKILIPEINAASQGNADKLNKAKARAVSQIKGGELQQAESTISAMEGALAKLAQAKVSRAEDKSAERTNKKGTDDVEKKDDTS